MGKSFQGRSLRRSAPVERKVLATGKVQPVCSRAIAIDLQTAVPFGCNLGNQRSPKVTLLGTQITTHKNIKVGP